VGDLERRARRLEEQAEYRTLREQLEAERVLREALGRVSTPELRAMNEHFEQADREEWGEEDEPLMRRLAALMEDVRREKAREFQWQSEIERKE
jgi:hypothetical protein